MPPPTDIAESDEEELWRSSTHCTVSNSVPVVAPDGLANGHMDSQELHLHHLSRPQPLPPPSPPAHLPSGSRRRRHHFSLPTTKSVRAPGLRLPGEAQPKSVRRCTCRHKRTPGQAFPSGVPGKLVQTRHSRNPAPTRVKPSSSTSDSDSVTDSSSSSAMESALAAGVHGLKSAPSTDPECGPNPALFILWGKVRKPPLKRLISGTSTNVRRRGRSR